MFPVVTANHQHELAVRIVTLEGFEGVPSVRWPRQVHLVVADHNALHLLHRQSGHLQPLFIVEQVAGLFQGVLGRHHQPHLVESRLLFQLLSQ